MKKISRLETTTSLVDEYVFSEKELQNLIDIVFEMVYRTGEQFGGAKYTNDLFVRERSMGWVAEHLRQAGIYTKPIGSSWGVIK